MTKPQPKCKAQDPANCRYHKTGFYVEFRDMRTDAAVKEAGKLTPCQLKALRRSLFMRDCPGNSEDEVIDRVKAAHNQVRFLETRRIVAREKKEIAAIDRATKAAQLTLEKARASIDFLYPRDSVRLLVMEVFADPHKLLDDLTLERSLDLFVADRNNFNTITLDYAKGCIGLAFENQGNPPTLKPWEIVEVLLGPWHPSLS